MNIEISIGELVDKVTILSIKLNMIDDPEKLKNISKEYDILKNKMESVGITSESEEFNQLLVVNQKLWDIENRIRLKEAKKEFDDEFIEKNEKLFKFIKPQKDKEARKINKALRKLSKD